ncbi:hypothetical protein PVAND_000324 [Polypedilum vanderplanki]|uniref:Uncharacterized protein n=1 Tax=Polypedilum vanderplanki TaxID=319348 RepID=A0A9J6BKZ2_POLVA|nr:hypothetical protein PVAND_000324 [Polypedilum vanderplanki]
MIVSTNGLQCYQCGQFNDGVGSITPCLNYTETNAHFYLKDCPRRSDKFCVKYVSELSTVRDCVESCVEKEVWDTSTYCCNQDGCNDSTIATISRFLLILATFISLCYFNFV